MPNPYYEPELRCLSGQDQAVRDYLAGELFDGFLRAVAQMIESLIPQFRSQGRHRLLVAFGCMGGRHRSVAAAEELYGILKAKGETGMRLIHRDAQLEAHEIGEHADMQQGG